MFDMLMGPRIPETSTNFISTIQNNIKYNQSFLRTVQKWRNLQVSYFGKLAQLHNEAIDRNKKQQSDADSTMILVLESLQSHHKKLANKINQDIFMINFSESEKLIYQQKLILQNEKLLHKQLLAKKEILQKVRIRKLKLKKSREQQLTMHVFSHDSVEATMDKKVKRFNKVKEIQKQQQQYQLKVKQTKQIFDAIIDKAKSNLRKFNQYQNQLSSQKLNIVQKMQRSLIQFGKQMVLQQDELAKKFTNPQHDKRSNCDIQNQFLCEEESKIINTIKIDQGYLQNTLNIIHDKNLDIIIEYSKDKQVKKRIKQIIQTEETNPQNTDEFTRQVQLVKKFMKSNDSSYIDQYKAFIQKGWKFRMNFVFILQMFRLNSKFEISQQQLKPVIVLINQLLEICHKHRDAFILKQVMVLMLTYYITYENQGKQQKIYILNFFKKHTFWKDLQLWESILIQCIYVEKKATIKMILTTSMISNKNELVEAQKTSILNQILYVVRNMVLFDFKEKQVKQFSNKFVKMLKQDDKFLKDVYKIIDGAIRQQEQNKPPEKAHKFIQQIIKKVYQP